MEVLAVHEEVIYTVRSADNQLSVKDLAFVLNPMIGLTHKHGQGEDLKRSCEITYESFIKTQ